MLIRRVMCDAKGICSVEFAIVCSLFFMMVLGIIDFSRAMWEYNAAAIATQAGARYAIVSDLVSNTWMTYDGTTDAKIGFPVSDLKGPMPNPIFCTVTGCGGTQASATNSADLRKVTFTDAGGNPVTKPVFDLIVERMQAHFSRIAPENVVVKLEHVGMGMAGNPFGPDIDPMVTVSLTGMNFTFLTPGLANLPTPISMGPVTATYSGEDGIGS